MEINIGTRLREERERLGLSQPAMGEIGGVKKLAQLKYEQNESSPSGTYFAAIAKMGADVQYIITGVRSAAALSPDENELVRLFRAAPLAVKASTMAGLAAGGASAGSEGVKQVFHGAVSGGVAARDIINNPGKAK